MPTTEHGKAIASRNATTHGVFARDIVLPALGENPEGYQQVQDELVAQLRPGNLLERHYVEKIAAASWRLRRLHRWQAQLFEDAALTEDTRLDKLDKVLRHETALQRQIDTAVRMLAKDVPNLYARRAREEALEQCQLSERECLADGELDTGVAMEARNRLYQLRKATNQAVNELSVAPLDTPTAKADEESGGAEIDDEEIDDEEIDGGEIDNGEIDNGEIDNGEMAAEIHEICRNERVPVSYRLHRKSGTFLKSGSFLAPRSGAS